MGWISSAISAVGSFISSAASTIGTAVSGFAKSAFGIIAKLPIPGLELINVISIAAKIIHAVVEFLGIKSEEDPEVLGAKAEQSEKSLEDFDNDVEAYIKYLKEEVELDKERFEKMTPEERMGCKAIGMALETKAVEEKIGGIEISPECLATLTKIQSAGINIDAKELVGIVQALKEQGITNMNDVVEFLDGKGSSDRLKTGEAMTTALGDGAATKIMDLQDAVRKYEEE
ncbi:MAG: hypothetical protein UIC64_09145 [Agathobacter sp.]|nr:hypothetical protein [Agathobacter sp.]